MIRYSDKFAYTCLYNQTKLSSDVIRQMISRHILQCDEISQINLSIKYQPLKFLINTQILSHEKYQQSIVKAAIWVKTMTPKIFLSDKIKNKMTSNFKYHSYDPHIQHSKRIIAYLSRTLQVLIHRVEITLAGL